MVKLTIADKYFVQNIYVYILNYFEYVYILCMCVIGKESNAKLQGLLVELSRTKTKDNLSSVNDDDKVRLWQDSQTMDSNSEIKQNYSQKRNDTENSDELKPASESELVVEPQARPQEKSKKTKRKKAKNKKAESLDMLRHGQEGELVDT